MHIPVGSIFFPSKKNGIPIKRAAGSDLALDEVFT